MISIPPLSLSQQLYRKLIQPRSASEDSRRREFILNILIIGVLALAIAAFAASALDQLTHRHDSDSFSLLLPLGFVAALLALWWLSRIGHYIVGAYVLLLTFLAIGTYGILQWSFEIPEGELVYALVIVMTSVLISTTAAIIMSGVISAMVIGVAILQADHYFHPDISWLTHPLLINDAIVYAVTFGVIALISWLSNREIDRSLKRARSSEAELKNERDNLEVKVADRTRKLEQAQMERVLELQRFAEFGRLSSGLLHDLTNPLTAASLNLKQAGDHQRSRSVQRALQSLDHLERYVEAARKQLRQDSGLSSFSVSGELDQVVSILSHKAKTAGVQVELTGDRECRLYGDAVKFNQLAANLIANAIEAYDAAPRNRRERKIAVEIRNSGQAVELSVRDWGSGISRAERAKLFSPFYSTKRAHGRNIGIGLSMVQRIVESDFGGSIEVTSTAVAGTCFLVRLHPARKHRATR